MKRKIGIGIVGTGYMGKRHAVAMQAVGATFDTTLRPSCECVCATTDDRARKAASALGFKRSTGDWRVLVDDPEVEAIVIASPQSTHREIALAAFALGKPVLCEKPMGASIDDSRAMVEAAESSGVVAMSAFNYVRTPATQFVRQLLADGAIGTPTWLRAEHTEDFCSDPESPATWRTQGRANGTLGDLAPHILNATAALVGPIDSLCADVDIVHHTRPSPDGPQPVTNDDQAHFICRYASGLMGHVHVSRIATGRKMGYAYEISGTAGAIRFDQEDQNAVELYRAAGPESERGFTKILTGPHHPDYEAFCLGPGHGTGYQDQLIIEARDFLAAIEAGAACWPTFRDALYTNEVIEAVHRSSETRAWVSLDDIRQGTTE